MYYKLVKGRLFPAPDNIRKLIGNPTAEQYLFFGYKPFSELVVSESTGYILDNAEAEKSEN